MDNLLTLLSQLTPLATGFVPQADEATAILKVILDMLAHIRAQSGKNTQQILDEAGSTLDKNELDLLADKLRLGGVNP